MSNSPPASDEPVDLDWVEKCARNPGHLCKPAPVILAMVAEIGRLRAAEYEFVQVGTWLLPEAYGPDYEDFTETKCATKPGICIAVYAKKSEATRMSSPSKPAQPFVMKCRTCGDEVHGMGGDPMATILGWEFTTETGWLCPKHGAAASEGTA